MANRKYTDAHIEFLRVGYKKMTVEKLAEKFNREFEMNCSLCAIKAILNKRKIKCGRAPSERFVQRQRIYTDKMIDFLRINFKTLAIRDLTAAFNKKFCMDKTHTQIRALLSRKGIKANRTGHFASNYVPWNTGTKGLTTANKTSFKAGHKPKNTKPIGYERVDKDGYLKVKVSEESPQFKFKHIVVYEKHYGPIPDGCCVIFKDSDIRNFDPENLTIVSRPELLQMNRNKYASQPGELKSTVLALSKLQVKTYEKIKETS
jgi:hypothetical protein